MSIIHGAATGRFDSEHESARALTYEEHVRAVYGLQPADFRAMFREQEGCCAICREDEELEVDHDHVDGHVRGLLCHPCNSRVDRPDGWVFAPRVPAYLAQRAPEVRITRL